MKTIIIDGKSIEISEDSYNNFKKQFLVPKLPQTFKELGNIIGTPINSLYLPDNTLNKRLFFYGKEAEMALAMAQLSQLKARYVDNWIPNWSDLKENKHCIIAETNKLEIYSYVATRHYLAFPTRELTEEFLKNFALLIKQYFGMEE